MRHHAAHMSNAALSLNRYRPFLPSATDQVLPTRPSPSLRLHCRRVHHALLGLSRDKTTASSRANAQIDIASDAAPEIP